MRPWSTASAIAGPARHLDAPDARLAAASTLHDRLVEFQRVDAVDVEAGVAHADGRLQVAAHRQVELGRSIAQRQGGARHHRDAEPAGGLVHRQGVLPDRSQVLVGVDGHHTAQSFEGPRDRLEEPAARVEVLPLVVPGILAVLADAQHAVNRDPARAQRDRLLDRGDDRDLVLRRQPPAQVALGRLVEVQGGQLQRGAGPAVAPPAFEDAGDQDVGVQVAVVFRDDGRDRAGRLLVLVGGLGRRRCEDSRHHAGAGRDGQRTGGLSSRHRSI